MLAVCDRLKNLETDKARLLDFYLLFPATIAKIRMPQGGRLAVKQASAMSNVYHDPISPVSTFKEMRHIQEAALKCIAAAGLIDRARYAAGFVTRTEIDIPRELLAQVHQFVATRQPIADYVLQSLAEMQLGGNDGLKHRSQLMEYRYDFV